jgi:hypothetical protein
MVGRICVDVNPQPAIHLASAHDEPTRPRIDDEGVGLSWIDAKQEATLTARADGQVPGHHERQTAEHGLLDDSGLAGQNLTQPIGYVDVVRHDDSIRG